VVKKVGVLKVVHERFRTSTKKGQSEGEGHRKAFANAVEANPELKLHIGKAHDDIHPIRALELFGMLSAEDCELLGLDPEHGHPRNFLWTRIPVPPSCIRPSVAMTMEGGSNEDDLTVKLSEIVYTNSIIRDALEKGSTPSLLMEDWDFLQLQCAMYINSELPGVPLAMQTPGKPIRGLCQRLKGKMGRFRGNLSGKRVDFSSRTVISPDPNLRINQIAVPVYVAKTLTYPQVVTRFNLRELRQAVINGPDVHPGANFVQSEAGGLKRYLRFGDRARIAKDLRFGDVVERHLKDGDVVLFNRQPSLHKLSIMAHFAVVKPWRTFRFNECACTPYNADFDGDEMNLHLPQTEEARAEAIELMGVQHNLVTPRNGQPLIAATQDFITASHLISKRDVFYDRAEFAQACAMMCDAGLQIDLPHPTVLRPAVRWTGKQVIGVLMRPNRQSGVRVNLELKGRTFERLAPGVAPEMCPSDGYLVVRNSQIMCGTLDKASVGGDSKGSIFYVLMRDYGSGCAVECMTRLAKLCARWLGNRGFSIGIDDVQPEARLRGEKELLVERGYAACDAVIADFRAGRLQNQPGCTAEQTVEASISGILSRIRDDVGQICLQELSRHNAPLIMQWCGSKGSKINVSQMVACVGQQIISGQRIPDGFEGRSLPHFGKDSRVPAAKGFVKSSFYSGLSPTEFFCHAVSGREGLVDTAVKTAETGYMQRRLMKALEDLSTHYDMSVRSATGGVVQFCYGDDGLDPAAMEGDGAPVNFARNLMHARATNEDAGEAPLGPDEVAAITAEVLEGSPLFKDCSAGFVESVRDFLGKSVAAPIAAAWALRAADPADSTRLMGTRLTAGQLHAFFKACRDKYVRARMEPGTAVGALGAQSIGEPGTQMTLKTFHFAGVASMNVTLGVPRIKEIINASKAISTPIITAKLVAEGSVQAARIAKGRIEATRLGDVAEFIEEVYQPDGCYLSLKLDLGAIQALQLETDIHAIEQAITRAPKLKVAPQHVLVQVPDRLQIFLPRNTAASADSPYYGLQALKRLLPLVVIKGYPTVNRAVINDLGSGKRYNLLVEGYGLRQVMTTDGVVGTQTTSNHIMEIQAVLGIEAARSTIAGEIQYTMAKHGMTIDTRHVALLADIMTCRGEVLGITRFGIAKMKDSVLMLASFEKTTDHLFDAARFSKQDDIDGVSECIIMGSPMPVGTGLFKLLQRVEKPGRVEPKALLFDQARFHPRWTSCK
jgi:DNA-directed RNA polymerase III subunit RPC1